MIASVRANPSHWMLVISSRISGCRVTDSITLPKMYPTPMPGPIVPRPAPTPSAIALPASETPVSVTPPPPWAIRSGMTLTNSTEASLTWLVLSGGGPAEVDGRERGEDEGLKRRDQADL